MKRQEYKVIFQPAGRHVFALHGTRLLEIAARSGLILQTPCGGEGTCGKCRVRVVSGDCPPTPACFKTLGESEVRGGARLACQAEIRSDLVVEIPESSLFETQQQILTGDSGEPLDIQPAVRKVYVEMPLPDQDNAAADVERLKKALGLPSLVRMDIHMLRSLHELLRANSYKGTSVMVADELIEFEPGNTTDQCYGVAFDIGTTTMVGTLINLPTGANMAVESCVNPQTSLGDDVISRIKKCRDDSRFLAEMQESVIEAVNSMIDKLSAEGRVPKTAIYEAVFAGNTTMQQIACGIDPSALGELPFAPAFKDGLQLKASDIGVEINRNGKAFVFPQIGGFVGGDTVAGVLATRLDRQPEPMLLVDVGTNGEIVLARSGKLTATSVAAGPAFEGARISCGMRATAGAVEKVIFSDDVCVNVIRNVRPIGLCGSGLIDAVAEMLRTGVLNSTGRIVPPDETPAGMPETIRNRILERNGHFDFVLVSASDTATGDPLVLCQRDIRELQLANGAIRAGINILLQMEGIEASQLSHILLAGAFGNFIRRSNAQRIGLLPAIPRERIKFIGNASSLGAKRTLLSVAEKKYASEIVGKTRHLDLSLSPEFQAEFGAAMLFPEEDCLA